MKLNDILKNIKEDWEVGFKHQGIYKEIFVNPSRSELRELGEKYRFIAVKEEQNLYVANIEILHPILAKKINKYSSYVKYFAGMAIAERNKIVVEDFSDSYFFQKYNIEEYFLSVFEEVKNGEYDWIERYGFYIPDWLIKDYEEKLKEKEIYI